MIEYELINDICVSIHFPTENGNISKYKTNEYGYLYEEEKDRYLNLFGDKFNISVSDFSCIHDVWIKKSKNILEVIREISLDEKFINEIVTHNYLRFHIRIIKINDIEKVAIITHVPSLLLSLKNIEDFNIQRSFDYSDESDALIIFNEFNVKTFKSLFMKLKAITNLSYEYYSKVNELERKLYDEMMIEKKLTSCLKE